MRVNRQDMNFAGQAFLNVLNVYFLYKSLSSKAGRRNCKLYMLENLVFLMGI
jgi:hypothetical protein